MTLTAEKIGTQKEWRAFPASDTGTVIRVSHSGRSLPVDDGARKQAIYEYLQTVRSLGKRRVRSTDVADALDIPEKVVRRVMNEMADKGVKAV